MKKCTFIVTFFCYISIYAQDSVDTNDILTAIKKDYLYNLVQINTNTILTVEETTKMDIEKTHLMIKKILKIDLQIKGVNHIWLKIKEDSGSAAIEASIYFILLRNTKCFVKKSGNGKLVPSKVIQTYKWILKDDLLIFIVTNRQLDHKLQRYVYWPKVE